MGELQRYDIDDCGGAYPHSEGDWVNADLHEAALAERDETIERYENKMDEAYAFLTDKTDGPMPAHATAALYYALHMKDHDHFCYRSRQDLYDEITKLKAQLAHERQTIEKALSIMGPTTPKCCQGCSFEWDEALGILKSSQPVILSENAQEPGPYIPSPPKVAPK